MLLCRYSGPGHQPGNIPNLALQSLTLFDCNSDCECIVFVQVLCEVELQEVKKIPDSQVISASIPPILFGVRTRSRGTSFLSSLYVVCGSQHHKPLARSWYNHIHHDDFCNSSNANIGIRNSWTNQFTKRVESLIIRRWNLINTELEWRS
jgi:hypothetical protein